MTASTPAAAHARTARLERRELGVEDERVERHVAAHAVRVELAHRLLEVRGVEVRGAGARVEALEAEVDGVGAGAHGGAHRLRVARGGEHFGRRGMRRGLAHRAEGRLVELAGSGGAYLRRFLLLAGAAALISSGACSSSSQGTAAQAPQQVGGPDGGGTGGDDAGGGGGGVVVGTVPTHRRLPESSRPTIRGTRASTTRPSSRFILDGRPTRRR